MCFLALGTSDPGVGEEAAPLTSGAVQGLGLWGHQESLLHLDISFPTRVIIREVGQGVGALLQVASRPLASSRARGDKHDRWPVVAVALRLVWEQRNIPPRDSQKPRKVGQWGDFSRSFS